VNSTCVIHHPQPGDDLHVFATKTGQHHFVAYGVAAPGVNVADGALYIQGNPTPLATATQAYNRGTFWVLSFTLDKSIKLQPGTYKLSVMDDLDTVVAVCRQIHIDVKSIKAIQVTAPADGDTVCPDFASYGTSDSSNPLVAQLTTAGGGLVANGTVLEDPPTWTVIFGGLVPGQTGVVLTISQPGPSPPAPAVVHDLTVLGCADVNPLPGP
jgi:hypothetical protein